MFWLKEVLRPPPPPPPSTSPLGAYIWRGDLTEGSLRYEFGGLYTRRGLFSEFYSIPKVAVEDAIVTPTKHVIHEIIEQHIIAFRWGQEKRGRIY